MKSCTGTTTMKLAARSLLLISLLNMRIALIFSWQSGLSSLHSHHHISFGIGHHNPWYPHTYHDHATSTSSTVLRYQDDGRPQEDDDEAADFDDLSPDQHPPAIPPILAIPVLGPFPGKPPLMVGAEMWLEPPISPMQWHVLEETFHIHQKHLGRQVGGGKDRNEDASSFSSSLGPILAGIEAAPIVAIMDQYTTGSMTASGKKGRYATLAAVVGIASSLPGAHQESSSSIDGPGKIDTTNVASFMESMRKFSSSGKTPSNCRIRFLGIGRAVLSDFFYQVPTSVQEAVDEEGHYLIHDEQDLRDDSEEEEDADEGDDEEPSAASNIIMAEFRLLMDQDRLSESYQRQTGRPAHISPVHALNAMSSLANQIHRTHHDRRKLVQGLQAAKARLQWAGTEADLEDYDGLGLLFSRREMEEEREVTQPLIEDLLHEFGPTRGTSLTVTKVARSNLNGTVAWSPDNETAVVESVATPVEPVIPPSPLLQMENYGLGYSAASLASVADLTRVWMEKLEPYYSREKVQSEEYYYEILSYVAMHAMDKYLEPTEVSWSLKCTNTLERLEQAYQWMWRHVRLLSKEAERMSSELRQCGEECTDLW